MKAKPRCMASFLIALALALAPGAAASSQPTPGASPAAAVSASPAASGAPSPTASSAANGSLTGPQVGGAAPAFSLRTVDGKTVTLDTYRGKTLVLNVWATWCPPCRQEMPDLIAAAPKLAKGNVALLGVDTTETAPIVRAYAIARNVPYPLAVTSNDAFAKAYDVQYFPTTLVIDEQGILRARYIDVISQPQLAILVGAAKAGKNGEIVSAQQRKIDATLADASIAFTDPRSVEANAKRAEAAIATAEKLLEGSDAAGGGTDLLHTRAEEAVLRDRAIAALVNVGTSVNDKTLLTRLRGDAARDREQWTDAAQAYRAVLDLDPKNQDALAGLALAARRLGDKDGLVEADAKLADLNPTDATALVDLARAQAAADKAADSNATFGKAFAIARQHVAANPNDAAALRTLGYVHLYAGRTAAAAGNATRARAEFDDLVALAAKLPSNDERHDMYLEEGQEAIVALGLQAKSGISVSLAPWTGADLPGSIPNTLKYRLVVAGGGRANVTLRASNVPKAWVASFCSDKVCAPGRVSLSLPDSGVKVVEFQLVPPGAHTAAPKVRVTGTDGRSQATATT